MRAATVVQQLCKSCRTCCMFYCMFYFTCDRSLKYENRTYTAESRVWRVYGQAGRRFGWAFPRRACQLWPAQVSTQHFDRPSRVAVWTSPWPPACVGCLRRLFTRHNRAVTCVNSQCMNIFRGYHMAVFILARISSPSINYCSRRNRELLTTEGLTHGPIWKQPCYNLFIIWLNSRK